MARTRFSGTGRRSRIRVIELSFTTHQLFDAVVQDDTTHCCRPVVRVKSLAVCGSSLTLVDEPDSNQFVEMVVSYQRLAVGLSVDSRSADTYWSDATSVAFTVIVPDFRAY